MVQFALVFGCLLLVVGRALPGQSGAPPHIVLILADDLGWGDVGFHGSEIRTPHIDALARRGVTLQQLYVQPVCSPTRGALLTGRYPMRLGLQCGVVRSWAQHGLPLDERTLPEALREAGYRTAICGKWHLGHAVPEYLPTQRGFDRQYGHYNGALDYYTHVRDGAHDWHEDDRANYDAGYATELIAAAAERVIEEHDRERPLFLYVPFNAPHTPLQAPEEYVAMYSEMADVKRRKFAAMVTCLDDGVGRILDALREHDFAGEDTLVIFCSDNGGIPMLGSNGELRGAKGTLYEGGVRVPAVMAWQGKLEPGATIASPLHVVDFYPTLLRLAGAKLEQAKPLDGRDAWPTLTAGAPTPHERIVHNVTPFAGAIREGDWKIVHNGGLGANATKKGARETWELFDIAKDPNEEQDLRAAHPDVFARMQRQLESLRDEAVPPEIPPNRAPADFRTPKVWGEPGGR